MSAETIRSITAEMRRYFPSACGDWADKIDADLANQGYTLARIEAAVARHRFAPFASADWLASEVMTILDSVQANDQEPDAECKFCGLPVLSGSVVEYDLAPAEPAHRDCAQRAAEREFEEGATNAPEVKL